MRDWPTGSAWTGGNHGWTSIDGDYVIVDGGSALSKTQQLLIIADKLRGTGELRDAVRS